MIIQLFRKTKILATLGPSPIALNENARWKMIRSVAVLR